jgi:hypothetical protein
MRYRATPGDGKKLRGRERVRRMMNYRTDAMCERVWLFANIHGDDAGEKLNETKQRIADVVGTRQHNFTFHDMNVKGSPGPRRYGTARGHEFDKRDCGQRYARTRTDLPAAAECNRSLVCPWPGANADADVAERGPSRAKCWQPLTRTRAHWQWNWLWDLTACSLARGIDWFTGCDMTGLHGPANQMLMTWSRIGRIRVPTG